MKLRRASHSPPVRKQKRAVGRDEVSMKEDEVYEGDTEDAFNFGEVLPFSPMSATAATEDEESKFKTTDDESCSKKNDSKAKRKRKKNTTKRKPKKAKIDDDNSCDVSFDDAKLEIVVDDSKIEIVKNVLIKFPEVIAKRYCKYIHDLQIKNNFKASNPEELSAEKAQLDIGSTSKKSVKDNKLSTQRGSTKQKSRKRRKSHRCQYCNKIFQKFPDLKSHREIHTKGYRCFCVICEKGFKQTRMFMEHISGHTGLFPNQCQQCGKTYRSFASLKEHEKVHKNPGPFQCTICDKKLSSEKYLKTHMFFHGEEKKFGCEICEKRFFTPMDLYHHRVGHATNNRPSTCDKSDSSLKCKNDSKKNRRQKHSKAQLAPTDGSAHFLRTLECDETGGTNAVQTLKCDETLRFESLEFDVNKKPLCLEKSLYAGLELEIDSEYDSESS